ncbi:probable serine/threonine-protein kinase clkA [Drosophila erecta]|uniref:probable serine/threonine-protein kinase clkA n=1 Tax=Drosophila erecta TaxID=7220 RepID=UPI000F04EE42|nr:probable serine/threonine-protein kinase clkA [Drosophila erecta]
MSVQWGVVLMSFLLFSTAQAGIYCGPNKIYACVPTQFCSDGRSLPRNPAAQFNWHCHRLESCCDQNRVIYGMRYNAGEFEASPYEQINEPSSNAGVKNTATNSQPTGNAGGNTLVPKKQGGFSMTNNQNSNIGAGQTSTINSQSHSIDSKPFNPAPSGSDRKSYTRYTNKHAHNILNNSSGKTNLGNRYADNTKKNLQQHINYQIHAHNNLNNNSSENPEPVDTPWNFWGTMLYGNRNG